jgi:hypothetical protein
MGPAFKVGGLPPDEAKVSLVDEGSTLEGMVRAFETNLMPGNAAQLLIDKGDEGPESLLIAGTPSGQ